MKYLQVLGALAAAAMLVLLLARWDVWFPVLILVSLFAILSVFSALAGALYERRHELGLETWHSPERTQAKEREQELRQREAVVLEAYGQIRIRARDRAWQILEHWLESRGSKPEDFHWLIERVSAWPDADFAHRLTAALVERLYDAREYGAMLDTVVERLRIDPAFRPRSAGSTLRAAELAAQGGGMAGTARLLLSDFSARFPNHPSLRPADALSRKLGPAR